MGLSRSARIQDDLFNSDRILYRQLRPNRLKMRKTVFLYSGNGRSVGQCRLSEGRR
jgi:hypothetical protein